MFAWVGPKYRRTCQFAPATTIGQLKFPIDDSAVVEANCSSSSEQPLVGIETHPCEEGGGKKNKGGALNISFKGV